jgi:predicted DNA binding CopG/RHH family protein
MRLPASLVEVVKKEAARVGMPYQRYIRQVLESALHHRR